MNISLPDGMRDFVEQQVKEGGYSTASEYIRALIREAQRTAAQAKLEGLLLDGLGSGRARAIDPGFWEDVRRAARSRLKARKGSHGQTRKAAGGGR